MFKVGDRVRCIRSLGILITGAEYQVATADPNSQSVGLSRYPGWWPMDAFELADSVTVANASAPQGNGEHWNIGDIVKCAVHAATKLVQGAEYKVEDTKLYQDGRQMVRLSGLAPWFFSSRFVLSKANYAAVAPDPSKPWPNPEEEAAKNAEQKLRDYRKSLRDLIGDHG